MTTREFLRVARTRWYVVLFGVALTGLLVLTSTPETVFWTSTDVTVVQPPTPEQPRTLDDLGSGAVPAAVVLMQLVNQGHEGPHSADVDATLYGEGKRDTVEARLRDIGGQWGSQVPNPVIDIQVVAHDPGTVSRRVDEEYTRLSQQLTSLQDQLRVAPDQRLTLQRSTVEPSVVEVGGNRSRALAASLLIGLALTVAGVWWTERVLLALRARRRRAGLVLAA